MCSPQQNQTRVWDVLPLHLPVPRSFPSTRTPTLPCLPRRTPLSTSRWAPKCTGAQRRLTVRPPWGGLIPITDTPVVGEQSASTVCRRTRQSPQLHSSTAGRRLAQIMEAPTQDLHTTPAASVSTWVTGVGPPAQRLLVVLPTLLGLGHTHLQFSLPLTDHGYNLSRQTLQHSRHSNIKRNILSCFPL